jgi:hypothetical protein
MPDPRRHIRRAGSRSQDGFALISVLIVGVILVVLSSLMLARGFRQLGNTGGDADWERALVTAEAGLDVGLLALEVDPDFTTGETLPTFTTPEQERDWVVSTADGRADDDVVATPTGDFVLVKPEGDPLLYAVGYAPDRDTLGRRTRVVRIGYSLSQSEWDLEFALLVGDELGLGGDAAIVDTNGNDAADVHANGIYDSIGSYSVDGCQTSSETAFEPVLNCPASPIEEQPMPQIDPLVFFPYAHYVMCPDEGIYAGPAYAGPETPANPDDDPCTSGDPVVVAGWSGKKKAGVVDWTPGDVDGVFYIHEGNVDGKIGKANSPVRATVVASASSTDCSGKSAGSVILGGGSWIETHPSLQGLGYDIAVVAQGDIKYRGTATVRGAILAHEQIDYRGTSDSSGAVVAASICHTNGSPVSTTELSGNAMINYPGPIRTPFTDVRWQADVVAWHEL